MSTRSPGKSRLLPTYIRFCLVESDDFLDRFRLRDEWTPFQAACLIHGVSPEGFTSDAAIVGIHPDERITSELVDNFDLHNPELRKSLRAATEAILVNNRSRRVNAKEILAWAISQGYSPPAALRFHLLPAPDLVEEPVEELGANAVAESVPVSALHQELLDSISDLTAQNVALQQQLDSVDDGRGKHHEEKRLAILGFALREIAVNFSDWKSKLPALYKGRTINAAGIAEHLTKYRDGIGIPDEASNQGFGYRNLEKTIRAALNAADKYSTHKTSVSTD